MVVSMMSMNSPTTKTDATIHLYCTPRSCTGRTIRYGPVAQKLPRWSARPSRGRPRGRRGPGSEAGEGLVGEAPDRGLGIPEAQRGGVDQEPLHTCVPIGARRVETL